MYTSNGKIAVSLISSTSFKAHHCQSVKSNWAPSFIFVKIDKQQKKKILRFYIINFLFSTRRTATCSIAIYCNESVLGLWFVRDFSIY